MDLSKIVVLYRDRNLQLWGIPYRMREEIGQTPRHLQEPGGRSGPLPAGWYGSQSREEQSAHNTRDWVWLGSPGWFGSMSAADMEQVKAYLQAHKADVPRGFFEWSYVLKVGDWWLARGGNYVCIAALPNEHGIVLVSGGTASVCETELIRPVTAEMLDRFELDARVRGIDTEWIEEPRAWLATVT